MRLNSGEAVAGQVASEVQKKLEEKDWSILRLSKELDASYEHTRKIVHGLAFPSKRMLRDICHILGLDFKRMEKLAVADRIERRYGGIPLELAGKNPRFIQVERILPHLSDEQFQNVLAMLQDMDRRNRGIKKRAH
jgi:hypothetical protein